MMDFVHSLNKIDIQIFSDLHLETPEAYNIFEITPKAPILALLGDIGYVRHDGFLQFLDGQLKLFRKVLLIFGNHEPWGSDWKQAAERVRAFADAQDHNHSGKGELILLDQTRVDLSDEVTVLGCTLFSHVPQQHEERVSFGLNDFYYIEDGWDIAKHNQAHASDLAWLNTQVAQLAKEEPHRRVAIFSHHSPTVQEGSMNPKHANKPLTSGFATDLSEEACWRSPNVRVWAFGHTHFNYDFEDGATAKRVVTNQRGYYFAQAVGFDAEKLVST